MNSEQEITIPLSAAAPAALNPARPEIAGLPTALQQARQVLLDRRVKAGHWEGELSSSALSTAITVCALRAWASASRCPTGERLELEALCQKGLQWLAAHQNDDGGWGDTLLSHSNISTTALCWGALSHADSELQPVIEKCECWLLSRAGSLAPAELADTIRARYGKDHTFSVPILTALALTGRLGEGRDAWKHVPQLPFELAACPRSWFAALQLPVVSYALPALIAIGQVRHANAPSRNPVARAVRHLVRARTLRVLEAIQPTSGGFLEATPLTSFVVLSLTGMGEAGHPVADAGVQFLKSLAREDGSWAIDSNLATWVTTLSTRALLASGSLATEMDPAAQQRIRNWLLGQQYRQKHPYTHAAPGGWAWTDLPGGVPDADDTPGALLALHALPGSDASESRQASAAGVRWLLGLQNRDGGIPTFCRGWGALPFDESSCDLTAHTLRAWRAWEPHLSGRLRRRIRSARARALSFLMRRQEASGAWLPLWFGNQHSPTEDNPLYGTSRVLLALAQELETPGVPEAVNRGVTWLLDSQNSDGGWGGDAGAPSSLEETSLAVESLASLPPAALSGESVRRETALLAAGAWLVRASRGGKEFPPAPIGFYFAKLWYYEDLYPVIFSVAALSRLEAWQDSLPADDLRGEAGS